VKDSWYKHTIEKTIANTLKKFIFSLKSGVLNTPASPEFGAGAIFSYSFPN
jgi:hypothetical protein